MNTIKKTPQFKTEAEERVFWEKNDSSDYVDWQQAQVIRGIFITRVGWDGDAP